MPQITKQDIYLAKIAAAILETIQETPSGVPGGHIYAALMSQGWSLDQFEQLMQFLLSTGKIRKSGHCYFAV